MAERDQKAIIQRLTEQMDKDNLDALILTSGDAVFYATGYASRDLYKNGQTGGTVAVVTKDGRPELLSANLQEEQRKWPWMVWRSSLIPHGSISKIMPLKAWKRKFSRI